MTVTICLTVSLTAIRVVFIKSYSTFFGIRGMCFPLLLNSHTVCVFSAVFGSRIQMHSLFCAYSAEMLPCIRSSRLRAISKPRPVREKALPHSSCAQSFFAAYEQPVPNSMLTPFMNVYTIWASSTPAKLFGSLSKIFNICICSLFCICFMYPFYEYTKSELFCNMNQRGFV